MDIYKLPEIQKQYFSHSQYSPPAPTPSQYVVGWPSKYHCIEAERPFIDELLSRPVETAQTLADEIFGRQLKHTRLTAKHTGSLLAERAALHYRHVADIQHRHMKCQVYLSQAQLMGQADGGRRLSNLERLLFQLESDQRREDLTFWKDTLDLRRALFDKALEHATVRDRASMLGSLGGTYGSAD